MSTTPLSFGGQLGAITDSSGVQVSPRCFGAGSLVVQDPQAFAAACASAGGQEAMVAWIQGAIVRQIGEKVAAVGASGGAMKAISVFTFPDPVTEIANAVSAQLAQARATVEINEISVSVSEEERAALMAVAKEAAARNREAKLREMAAAQGGAPAAPAAPSELAAGTRVLATWTDGRAYPGTVQRTQNGYYEVTWEAGGNAWVPIAQVQPR